jgi:hypothetical protein
MDNDPFTAMDQYSCNKANRDCKIRANDWRPEHPQAICSKGKPHSSAKGFANRRLNSLSAAKCRILRNLLLEISGCRRGADEQTASLKAEQVS